MIQLIAGIVMLVIAGITYIYCGRLIFRAEGKTWHVIAFTLASPLTTFSTYFITQGLKAVGILP